MILVASKILFYHKLIVFYEFLGIFSPFYGLA